MHRRPSGAALSGHGSGQRRESEDVRLEFVAQFKLTLRQMPGLLRDVELVDYRSCRSELQPDVANTGGTLAP